MFFSWLFILVNAVSAALVLSIVVVIRRLYFHPLRGFKGPPLAAASTWYQVYWDLVKQGGLVDHLKELHEIYGSVVRIGPNELHFNDVDAYGDIYRVGSKFTKYSTFYQSFDQAEGSFGFIDPKDSKVRRDILNPLFSRRAIIKLESVIQERVDKLLSILSSYAGPGMPVNLAMGYRCLSLDVISAYCFAQCFDALATDGFTHPIIISQRDLVLTLWIFKHFPFFRRVVTHIPAWFMHYLLPSIQGSLDMRKQLSTQVDKLLSDPTSLEFTEHENIYHHLLTANPEKGHYHVPSRRSLIHEALTLIGAGSDTVGNTCAIGTFYLLNSPTIYAKLLQELREAWPDPDTPMTYERLEKLPYLTAVIKESLRMAHGVVTPLPRIVGPTDTAIAGLHVPAGTIVSMSIVFMHHNPNIYSDPFTFSPERWLGEDARGLENYFAPFSRGPRMCLGINLAWSELYLIFGHVFRKMNMELHNTTPEDLKFSEFFVPVQKGNPISVIVKGSIE